MTSAIESRFAITKKWPPAHPDRIQLYSLGTPNGMKALIALEELGLDYELHSVSFDKDEQHSSEFLSLNPNGKIPAMIDPAGPGGEPIGLFESGAILFYLAEKTGRLMPRDPAGRYAALQWLMFQMAGVGPMFGQVGFFNRFAGREYEDKRPLDRYVRESRRLIAVLEERLHAGNWLFGDEPGIVDIATFPWVRTLVGPYMAHELVGFDDFPRVRERLAAFLERPAVKRSYEIAMR